MTHTLHSAILQNVKTALEEDIGSGDITAQLIAEDAQAKAHVITRERCVVCGIDWVNEVFKQVDKNIHIEWHVSEGDTVQPNTRLFSLAGPARGLLTGERAALNFLQTLSGTATICKEYASMVSHTSVKLLDTRKTIPGLRQAQKYAVTFGGCYNHRIGLYDAFLIKENHIMACGSIKRAVEMAHTIAPGKPVEVEVESLKELEEALNAKADIIMLDNFDNDALVRSVDMAAGIAKLEASGGINKTTLTAIAETGVDYISIGALTKDCKAIDLSMRFSL
ncbi:carboxylating nicotinate-nucleotide diphosphorylase [Alkalimarinus alittae]|uniref:nicotinate-nucleotide diphosphorylase (carboxylating) n=1 Tax=Alkalimarinus alittae TaxID=2961619 RepID=A0ABY6MYT2_9ALTE|nr:carboxylating nicotinate-nucleotide diphosphorylase [Alkalimarinus alittae]UZE94996.1 carboxylating nicotinate-nucleotide diphosphorylase [Alkalimarinus alittae]